MHAVVYCAHTINDCLFQLTDLLGEAGVCYRTQKLQSGDYAWLWRSAGKELTLPLLVERKRAG